LPISKLAKRVWFLLLLAIAAFYLYGLGALPLVGPDEPRYAQVAREMLQRRDLITPTLGGFPWFEKPPLLYWLMIASYRVFGVSEFSARLGPALCGLVTAGFVWWVARNIEKLSPGDEPEANEYGQWSVLVFLSSLGAIAFSRAASFDILLTMTLTAALSFFFVWHLRQGHGATAKKGAALLTGFYFFVGLSLLAKGLVGGVLAFGVIAAYLLARRERPSPALMLSLLWGLPVTLIISGTWYGPMIQRHGWLFIDQFIIKHHFARFLTNRYHHPQPFYFYLPILALISLPWTAFLVASFASVPPREWRAETAMARGRLFWFVSIVVVVLLFSVSGSKLPAYILPALPGAALLVAERIIALRGFRRGLNLIRLTAIIFILGGAGVIVFSVLDPAVPKWCVVSVVLTCFAVGAFALLRPRHRVAALQLFAGAAVVVSAIALHCSVPVVARESVRDLLRTADSRGYGAARLVGLHTVERPAEFYAAGRIAYQADGEPVKFEGAGDVVEFARSSGGIILCFVPSEFESQLTSYSGVETELVGSNGKVSLWVVKAR
jgi:4-amino-4-deoxy-L-arabinose transferase-like glycosyltransferase